MSQCVLIHQSLHYVWYFPHYMGRPLMLKASFGETSVPYSSQWLQALLWGFHSDRVFFWVGFLGHCKESFCEGTAGPWGVLRRHKLNVRCLVAETVVQEVGALHWPCVLHSSWLPKLYSCPTSIMLPVKGKLASKWANRLTDCYLQLPLQTLHSWSVIAIECSLTLAV